MYILKKSVNLPLYKNTMQICVFWLVPAPCDTSIPELFTAHASSYPEKSATTWDVVLVSLKDNVQTIKPK